MLITFSITNVEDSFTYSASRINDFETSRNSINIEGLGGQLILIDLTDLPDRDIRLAGGSFVNVRIVQYTSTFDNAYARSVNSLGLGSQQLLQIGEFVFIALDGSREGGLEWHFPTIPADTGAVGYDQNAYDNTRIDLTEVAYHEEVNFVPYDAYSAGDIPIYNLDEQYTAPPTVVRTFLVTEALSTLEVIVLDQIQTGIKWAIAYLTNPGAKRRLISTS